MPSMHPKNPAHSKSPPQFKYLRRAKEKPKVDYKRMLGRKAGRFKFPELQPFDRYSSGRLID
jgi:hypothetical protein